MKTKSLNTPALLALVTTAVQLQANLVTVSFTATITQSEFVTPGYTVGSVVKGFYDFDSAANPTDSGSNYTDYRFRFMGLFCGGAYYHSAIGTIETAHYLPQWTPHATDTYEVRTYAYNGPLVEGFGGFGRTLSTIYLTDTDNSVYANNSTPYPIDLPDPTLFEIKEFDMSFLQGPLYISKSFIARINRIQKVPEHDSGFLSAATLILMLALSNRFSRSRLSRKGSVPEC